MSDRISIYFTSIHNFFFFLIFDKMADVGYLGCPKFTFDRISGNFRSIGHFGFQKFTFDRNSGHFRSIQNFFSGGHFGCPQITFERYTTFSFFNIMAAGGHFGWETMSIIELVRDLSIVNYQTCPSNACVKLEERSSNPSKVITLTTKL